MTIENMLLGFLTCTSGEYCRQKRPTIIKEELDVELPRLHLQNFGLGDLFI